MQPLRAHLDTLASCVTVSLENPDWHIAGGVPTQAGWYFFRTTAPVDTLREQSLWAKTYTKARSGETSPVRNYDIAARASRYTKDLREYWNTVEVYSGMASNLRSRAREHTFADPGTGGLALARYPALRSHEWVFGFVMLSRFMPRASSPEMLLRLGEQMWRAKNGWPLLCAE